MCLFVNCGDTNAHSAQATFRCIEFRNRALLYAKLILRTTFFNYLCHFDRTTVCGEISHYYCFTNRFLHACGYAALCRNDRVQVITTHLFEMAFFIEHISNQAKAAATFSLGGT